MITVTEKSNCCGCWACYNICPKNCITMAEDDEGFCYPKVNIDSCIDCHLCEKVCPILKPVLGEKEKPEAVVVQNKNKQILRKSTSGGFYSEIASFVVEQGGVVFGAAFDENMILRHQYSETIEGCESFRGSKYVQSIIGDSYQAAKHFLDDGRWVAFSGTPCQISGLVGFLRNQKYEKLILVDLACHGTPSPRVLREYLAYHQQNAKSKVVGYLSRDKYYGYLYSTVSIFFENQKKNYHHGMESDFMLRAYFKGLISRPSCHSCHFRTLHRQSDFTIFDCWDAPSVSSKFNKNGATNVLIHTDHGKKVFDIIKQNFIFSKRNLEDAVMKDGSMILANPPRSKRRESFFEALNSGMNLIQLEKKFIPISTLKKILNKAKPFLFHFGFFSVYLKCKKAIK